MKNSNPVCTLSGFSSQSDIKVSDHIYEEHDVERPVVIVEGEIQSDGMQIEPFKEDDGYRCWLSTREQNMLVDYYSDDLEKQLAVELMLDGLRSGKVLRVSKEDFRRLDTEEEAYNLRIWQSKPGFRECPVSRQTRRTAVGLMDAKDLRQDQYIVDVTERTVQCWVSNAAEDIAGRPDGPTTGSPPAHTN